MRCALAAVGMLVGALALGQGFNKHYDAFGNGTPQGSFGIERTSMGYTAISNSHDTDSLGPDSFFFHTSILLTFIDESGTVLSEKRGFRPWQNTAPGWANCCDTIPGGGYVVGAGTQDTNSVFEVYLMRLDEQGDTLWNRVFGGQGKDWVGRQVKRTPDGGFIVAGDVHYNAQVDGFALKTDSLGNEEWRQIYPGGGVVDIFIAVDMVLGGGYYLGGQKRLSFDDDDLWAMRIGSNGAVQWQRSWGGPYAEVSAHLTTLSNGNALVASAWCYSSDDDTYRFYLAELDGSDGTTVWEQQYGPIAFGSFLFTGKELPNGDLISCGTTWMNFDQQGVLLRTTSTGDSLWMRTYYYEDTLFTDGTGRFYDVLPTSDGGFIAAGVAYQSASLGYPAGYSPDTWIVKVDSMGCIVPGCNGVGVEEIVTNLSNALTVYPNPAHGSTTVHVELPTSLRNGQALRLSVVNAQGQLVAEHRATQGENALDLSELSAGLYYVHLADGTTWLSGTKLIVE